MGEVTPVKRNQSQSFTAKSGFVDYDYLIKVVVVGDSGVGKSQLVARFTRNEFTTNSRQTIGVEFATKTIDVNSKKICAQMWDTAGEERYRALASAYYRGAVGVLLVFDVTNARSFKNLAHWLSEIKAYTVDTCQMILVGNKIDLQGNRKISNDQARAFADINDMRYIETSALQCTNVEASFTSLVSDIYQNTIAKKQGKNTVVNTSTGNNRGLRVRTEDGVAASRIKTKCCWAM